MFVPLPQYMDRRLSPEAVVLRSRGCSAWRREGVSDRFCPLRLDQRPSPAEDEPPSCGQTWQQRGGLKTPSEEFNSNKADKHPNIVSAMVQSFRVIQSLIVSNTAATLRQKLIY